MRSVPGYHSPLEGESQKPSRMAMADAVGGWTRCYLDAPSASQAKVDAVRETAALSPSADAAFVGQERFRALDCSSMEAKSWRFSESLEVLR